MSRTPSLSILEVEEIQGVERLLDHKSGAWGEHPSRVGGCLLVQRAHQRARWGHKDLALWVPAPRREVTFRSLLTVSGEAGDADGLSVGTGKVVCSGFRTPPRGAGCGIGAVSVTYLELSWVLNLPSSLYLLATQFPNIRPRTYVRPGPSSPLSPVRCESWLQPGHCWEFLFRFGVDKLLPVDLRHDVSEVCCEVLWGQERSQDGPAQ